MEGDATASNNNSVTATLNYMLDDGITPWFYNRPMTKQDLHSKKYGGTVDPVRTVVRSGRDGTHGGQPFTLDQHAFQLASQTTKLTTKDFYNDPNQIIKSVYYKEMEELIQHQLGAAKVVVFTHQVRNECPEDPNATGVQGYFRGVHVDFASNWAEEKYRMVLEDHMQQNNEDMSMYTKGRFVIVNAWRNIGKQPIEQDHLAVCDETTLIKPDDYVTAYYYGSNRKGSGKQFRLASRNAHRHRWYYFPNMTSDEVLLFKQWDSDNTKSGRSCFHSAFHDSTARADAPPRESIEVRAVAFFPDHQPNTCPVQLPVEVTASKIAEKLTYAVENAYHWPLMSRLFFRWTTRSRAGTAGVPAGVESLVDILLKDSGDRIGLDKRALANPTVHAAAKSLLLRKDSTFIETVLKAKLKLDREIGHRRRQNPWTWWLSPWSW